MRRRLNAALCLLAAWGCECGDESLGVVAPKLEIATDPIAFGEVPLGATKRVAVAVRNVGSATLELTGVDAVPPFGAEVLAASLEPGEQTVLDVFFRPTNDEPQSGLVTLASNDPDAAMISVPVSGQGIASVLTVQPTQVDFQDTKVGTARSVELVLDNRGLEPVSGTIVPEGFAQPEHFSLTLLPSFADTAAFGVPARTEQVLELVYQPVAMGEHAGRLVFEVCGARCGLEVEVLASASESAVRLVPAVADFGEIGLGQTRTVQLRLENSGGEPVSVTAVSASGNPGLSVQVSRALPAMVAPSDALGINVELTPSVAGEISGEVLVTTGPVVERLRAAVTARAVGPLFIVEPDTLSFGVEREPGTYRRALLLVNGGSSDVSVTALSTTGDPAFALDALPGLPVRLGSGESLVVPVLFRPTAIAEYRGAVLVASDDPTQPTIEVSVTGALADRYCELEVRPNRMSFGLLPPGFTRQQTAWVENVGTDDCVVLSGEFRLPADPAIRELNLPWPRTLAAGDQVELEIAFAPSDQRESKSTYVMLTDDEVFPERTVSVFGTSVGNLDVFTRPSFVDFGAMRAGCGQVTKPILLINGGTIDVDISSITVTASTSELAITSQVGTPLHLASGGIVPLEVGYAAQDLGVDVGDLKIHVDDYGFDITVPLQGEGAQNPVVVDRFEQARNDKVDVLFVIDDSCSMGDDQQALAANFASFIRQADVRQVDFQIGITTTTVWPIAGQLRGPIMTRQTSQLEQQFRAQAAVGINGSGFEQGLEAMLGVFQEARRSGTPQSNLLRPDAARAIIVVSDEDDQSPLAVVSYLAELTNNSPQGYVTAMVSGQLSGCSNPMTGSAYPARRYVEFAQLTGGLDASICSDWASTLANIGQLAFGLKSRFLLSRDADQSYSIEVRIDGIVQSSGWRYEPADHSIVFTQPPPEGARIEVEFTPTC